MFTFPHEPSRLRMLVRSLAAAGAIALAPAGVLHAQAAPAGGPALVQGLPDFTDLVDQVGPAGPAQKTS